VVGVCQDFIVVNVVDHGERRFGRLGHARLALFDWGFGLFGRVVKGQNLVDVSIFPFFLNVSEIIDWIELGDLGLLIWRTL